MAQPQGNLLEVLKKKMRAMKDELEQANEENETLKLRVLEETRRREEVGIVFLLLKPFSFTRFFVNYTLSFHQLRPFNIFIYFFIYLLTY